MAIKGRDLLNRESKPKQITTAGSNRNKTTNVAPVMLRLTENNKVDLALWLEQISGEMDKQITPAKLFRGLLNMRDDISMKKLKRSINEAN